MRAGQRRMYLFTGHRDHKIDGKDRIVIPAHFAQDVLREGGGVLYLVPGADGPFLEAYPGDVFGRMAGGQVPNRFDGDLDRKRQFFQTAERAELTGPGRIQIPKRYLPLFPTGHVRVGGMNTYLELWDPERWEARLKRLSGGAGAPTQD